MYDLVAYNGKRNKTSGEDNRDGSDTNFTWNRGVEGITLLTADARVAEYPGPVQLV